MDRSLHKTASAYIRLYLSSADCQLVRIIKTIHFYQVNCHAVMLVSSTKEAEGANTKLVPPGDEGNILDTTKVFISMNYSLLLFCVAKDNAQR